VARVEQDEGVKQRLMVALVVGAVSLVWEVRELLGKVMMEALVHGVALTVLVLEEEHLKLVLMVLRVLEGTDLNMILMEVLPTMQAEAVLVQICQVWQ